MRLGGLGSIRSWSALVALSLSAGAVAQVPIDGFLPMVGIAMTSEFDRDNFDFFAAPSSSPTSGLLGPASHRYDLALLDTGAGFSLLTNKAFNDFQLGSGPSGGSDGYRGTESIEIGGATGNLFATVNDPFGLYASGLQDRTGAGSTLVMNNAALQGQTNTSTLTFPVESDLPNVLGLPFASQYATRIRNDLPQVFELDGKTVRSPAIDFLPLGSGGNGITRKAQLFLNPGSSFTSPPAYFPNILGLSMGEPTQENPQYPTLTQGGLFVNATATSDGVSLPQQQYFFDTGASVTVLSTFNALALGFDVTLDDPEFTISIIGSGGLLQDVPGFFVDQITIPALGGSITATHVPVLVLDVTNPADPGNTVGGIIGTNILAGRNVVIDPNPSTGGGGQTAGLYVSDPVTSAFNWSSASASAAWSTGGAWSAAATPTYLSKANLQNAGAANKEAVVSGLQQAWDVTVGGAVGAMTVRIASGGKLTTFSGVTVNDGGVVQLQSSTLDAQYVDVRGGTLTGAGDIRTGSGPITGQVEIIDGLIAPGNGVGRLTIDGRLSTASGAEFQFELGGVAAGSGYDQLVITGDAAIAGTLSVSLVGPFVPAVGNVFELLTYENFGGAFSAINLPQGYVWDIDYTTAGVLLEATGLGLTGDFNQNGIVDAADYTVWRDGYGVTYDDTDYVLWASNFGATLFASTAASVPEPRTILLLAFVFSAAVLSHR